MYEDSCHRLAPPPASQSIPRPQPQVMHRSAPRLVVDDPTKWLLGWVIGYRELTTQVIWRTKKLGSELVVSVSPCIPQTPSLTH